MNKTGHKTMMDFMAGLGYDIHAHLRPTRYERKPRVINSDAAMAAVVAAEEKRKRKNAKRLADAKKVGAGGTAHTWICPRCKVDRFKEDCKGNRMTCPMVGIAHNAELRGRPLADGPA